MKRLKRGELVFVETLDIESIAPGWTSIGKVARGKPGRYAFVGWVLRDKGKTLVLSGATRPRTHSVHSAYRLPRGCITKIEKLLP